MQGTEDVSSQIESTENNNTSTAEDDNPSLPKQEKDRIIITIGEMDEENFIENLDTDILMTEYCLLGGAKPRFICRDCKSAVNSNQLLPGRKHCMHVYLTYTWKRWYTLKWIR